MKINNAKSMAKIKNPKKMPKIRDTKSVAKLRNTNNIAKKSKKPGMKKKKHLSTVSMDDFFNQNFENDTNSDCNNDKGKNIQMI